MHEYIFKSREGLNRLLTRQQALNVLKDSSKAIKIKENVGTHTLRKTWGYHAWQQGFSLSFVMETLNDSNLSITNRYLGISKMRSMTCNFNL